MHDLLTALNRLQPGDTMVIGSGERADVVIGAQGVEQRHARFVHRGSGMFVQDLDSAGGTFVNEIEVRGLVRIRAGDRIRIGSHVVVIGDGCHFLAGDPEPTTGNGDPRATGAGLGLAVWHAVKTVRARTRVHPSSGTSWIR
jgi:pSer/pThr/pTyr-binding forkhead associated (FHA) protein